MTIVDFNRAIDGFNDLEHERYKFQMLMTRKICWHAVKPHVEGELSEEDIISIPEIDEEIKKARRESLPIARVIIDGVREQ